MLQYVAALYDHLLRSKAVDIADGLPPVLPIVLYNATPAGGKAASCMR